MRFDMMLCYIILFLYYIISYHTVSYHIILNYTILYGCVSTTWNIVFPYENDMDISICSITMEF
jgi:hypothetical protein